MMKHKWILQMGLMVLLMLTGSLAAQDAPLPTTLPESASNADPETFASIVDLTAFGAIAIHEHGRIKSLDSFASGWVDFIVGSRPFKGQSHTFTFMDMMLSPERYVNQEVIFVKNKIIRARIIQVLQIEQGDLSDPNFEAWSQRFTKSGRIAQESLRLSPVQNLLINLRSDLMRTAKAVGNIEGAMSRKDSGVLAGNFAVIPPPGGTESDPWLTMETLIMELSHQDDHLPIEPKLHRAIATQWNTFVTGWRDGDAEAVTGAGNRLAELLPQINPGIYPATSRLAWESWYFKSKNLTWVWIIYLFSVVPLLASIAFRWSGARWLGLGMFTIAFTFHTFAVMLRWYVADRWPNTNMFEAITTAAWFGGCFAVLMELLARKTPMRNLFALGSAVASMVAMMATRLWPLDLSPSISNMMPVLHDLWLYIHTNVIIFSYCLIFLAAVTAGMYLLRRIWFFLQGKSGTSEFVRVGGAGSLMSTRPDGSAYLAGPKTTLGQVLDGSTMILMELSFILLWTGIVMGAIWADHSWGRPWGWDPKEVFALNTFIIFALLIHVRMKVKDKGLWTALLAVVGCGVMLFNWIIINFAIAGLHSYA